jgi:hypothetical protein
VAVATELAGTDPILAAILAKLDLQTLLAPLSLLGDHARRQGFNVAVAARIEEVFDGERRRPSALAALAGDHAEIERRIWRAQVGILYPFIEVRRLDLVPRVRSLLDLPVETTYGRVSDPRELEVGQLVHFLRGRRVPRELWQLLNHLKDMRHALAHLKPVPVAALFARELHVPIEDL